MYGYRRERRNNRLSGVFAKMVEDEFKNIGGVRRKDFFFGVGVGERMGIDVVGL